MDQQMEKIGLNFKFNLTKTLIQYSPSRLLKLKREIKVSNDNKQILTIYKKELESDIKSGWNKI